MCHEKISGMNVKSDMVLARLSKNPVRCGDKTTERKDERLMILDLAGDFQVQLKVTC